MQLANGLKVGDVCFCEGNDGLLSGFLARILDIDLDQDEVVIENLETKKQPTIYKGRLVTLNFINAQLTDQVIQIEKLRDSIADILNKESN
ncbi:MAG: hypothetical protein KME47_09825 [Nodosilinea sp. WJT8-NPBG4]|jgi:hypothetical protein|nr:hypothetical protein [Nodosilinea sp. WJT8-NPBG4]